MIKNNIFIHIPKTGGTTINCMVNKSDWQTVPDFNYRHIIYETKRSNKRAVFTTDDLVVHKQKRINIMQSLIRIFK